MGRSRLWVDPKRVLAQVPAELSGLLQVGISRVTNLGAPIVLVWQQIGENLDTRILFARDSVQRMIARPDGVGQIGWQAHATATPDLPHDAKSVTPTGPLDWLLKPMTPEPTP